MFFPGVLVDTTKNYSSAFYSCAAGMVLGAMFLALVRPCKTGLCHHHHQQQQQQQQQVVEESTAGPPPELPDDFIDMDIGKAEHSGKGSDSVV